MAPWLPRASWASRLIFCIWSSYTTDAEAVRLPVVCNLQVHMQSLACNWVNSRELTLSPANHWWAPRNLSTCFSFSDACLTRPGFSDSFTYEHKHTLAAQRKMYHISWLYSVYNFCVLSIISVCVWLMTVCIYVFWFCILWAYIMPEINAFIHSFIQ